MQHHPVPSYMAELPYQHLWSAQDGPPPPPMVPYQDLISGFPCSELGKSSGIPLYVCVKDFFNFYKFF